MRRGRLNIIQNLRVESVHQHDCVVRTQLVAASGEVRYATLCFDDPWTAFSNVAELQRWRDGGTMVSHVWGWGESVLVDEHMLLQRAAQDEPSL